MVGPTWMDGPMDGQTYSLMEMRGRKKGFEKTIVK